jgi:enoyl-CoA hydratase
MSDPTERAVRLVRINRPERRNAIDSDTAARLHDELLAFEADDSAGVAVLTGDEQAFCAGADLKDLPTLRPSGPLGPTRLQLSKPVIAAVEGWCVAGGIELAAWCDLRVAGESAIFGCLERRWGVPLIDGGTQRLPRIVGLGRALDLILSGRIVAADEAHSMGLVNEIVPEGRHLDRAVEMVESLAQFPQDTMLADRAAAIEGFDLPLTEALELEARSGEATLETAWRGAARFAGGEGRGGEGAGV